MLTVLWIIAVLVAVLALAYLNASGLVFTAAIAAALGVAWAAHALPGWLTLALTVLFVLLAIPFSFVNPRAGRSLNMINALVLYMLYNNLISVINSWVGQGKVPENVGLFGLHVLMIIFVVILFYYRMSVFSTRRILR